MEHRAAGRDSTRRIVGVSGVIRRIDVNTIAEVLEPGERLLVVLGAGESMPITVPTRRRSTVHGDGAVPSQIALPIVERTFGGGRPKADYPPRPHAFR